MSRSTSKKLMSVLASGGIIAGSLAVVGAPAEAASVSCTTYTSGGQGRGSCRVYSGQARLRADCAYAPDTYSPWVGKGLWALSTGTCAFSIRGVIVETRY
jgi:hypothetical protein